jgi:hypothetical protein
MDIVRAHRPTPFIRRTTILAVGGVAVAIALTSLGLRLNLPRRRSTAPRS